MSNSQKNREQNQRIEQTPNQINPGAARASDFKIENRDGGQHGTALLAEAEADCESEPIPVRNEVPYRAR